LQGKQKINCATNNNAMLKTNDWPTVVQ